MVQKFSGIPVKAGKKKYLERYYLFSENFPPGMNRSICIHPGITENSIQMVSAPSGATLKAGMTERRNGGIMERRKITPNPKRRNREITERRKIPPNPKRRHDGKSPKIPKDGITENQPKS